MQNYFITNFGSNMPKSVAYKHTNIPITYSFSDKILYADLYKMADTKSGEEVGHMYTTIERKYINDEIYPNVSKCDALKIEELIIKDKFRRKGFGSDFLNIAKAESKAQKCMGRVFLVATSMFDQDNPAHVFYRKKGFKTIYNLMNTVLDECVRDKKRPDVHLQPMYMYLPIGDKAPVAKRTIIKNFFKKLFKIGGKL